MDWLRPPTFPDPEDTERAAIVWATVTLGILVCGVQALIYIFTPTMASSALYLLPEVIGLLGALVALQRGYLRAPTYGLLGMFAALVTAFVFLGGGLEWAFPPLLGTIAIMGALMAGARAGLFLTLWAGACTTAVYLFGSSEVMLIEGQDRDAVLFTIQVITVLLGGLLVTFAVHRLSRALRAEREHAEAAQRTSERLRSSRRFVQDVLQSMAEAVVVANEEGHVRMVNDAALSLFGVAAAEQLYDRSVATLFDADDLQRLDATATPGATARGEGTLTISGDRRIPVRIARSLVSGEGGEALRVYVVTDIRHVVEAQRKSEEAARAAESANRAKSQFLANMSHELRTPLNAVIGYSDMLLDDLNDDDQRSDVDRIRGAGRHLLSLINDVLDMSKIEAGRMEVHLEPVSLEEALREVTAAVLPTAQRKGTVVTVERDPELDGLYTDSRKLRQILLNLASNAVKFTEGGSVTLRATLVDEALRVEVQDTGIGISGEQLEKLFQPFVQADNSTSRRYGGTGLGLALSQRFAELLGGELHVHSVPDMGSTFTLVLPLKHPSEATPAPEVDTGDAPLVLCVDDDPNMLDLLARLLRREGLRVAQAGNGADALSLAKEHRPSVVTLDVMMPEMDGWTLLQRMRAEPRLQDVPVVMVSMVDHDQGSALALGASDYLVKPVEPEKLIDTLRRYLATGSGSVLVVDDEDDIRELLRRSLVGEGWTVHTAPDSQAALEMLPDAQPDVVILDLMMPRMDGFAFVDRVRGDEQWRDLPIVVLTAMELTREQWSELAGRTSQIVHKGDQGLRRVLHEVRTFARRSA